MTVLEHFHSGFEYVRERKIMSHRPRNEEDIEAKLIFLRLQPVINSLLSATQAYQVLVAKSPSLDIQKVLSVLQTQSQLLERLHKSIIPSLATEHQLSNVQLSNIFCLLLDYLLFPILAILKGTKIGWNGEDPIEDQPALRSATFLVVQHAASLLCALLDIMQFPPEEKFIRCLVACAFALPTSHYLTHNYRQDSSLDRGEICLNHLFDSIRRLVGHPGLTRSGTFASSLAKALDGALLARLADCIVALVEPSESGKCANVDLQIQALLTLQVIMKSVPFATVWRHMFPGIFAGVYRCCLQAIRIAQRSPKLASAALSVISDLLKICLQSTPMLESSATDTTSGSKEKAVIDRLKSLALNTESVSIAGVPGHAESNEDEFVSRANKFLPTPLTILINMTAVAQTPQVREKVVGLLSVVLVESLFFWKSDANILTVAFESCLVLSQDNNEDISSSASAVLRKYKEKIGSDYLTSLPRVIGPRVMSIVGGLPAILEAARETDLVASLRLINGYLKAMTLSKDTSRKLRTFTMAEENMAMIRDVFSLLCRPSAQKTEAADNEPLSLKSLVLKNERRINISIPGSHNGEVRIAVESTLCSLSQLLGMKATVYAVDQCVADLYAENESRLYAGVSQNGLNQIIWANSWAGTIYFASFLLKGLTIMELNHQRKKVLQQLANSTLPLIFSDSIWGMPTDGDSVASNLSKGSCHALTRTDFVSTAMSANADLVIALLGIVDSITNLMDADSIDGHIDIMLLPLLDKTNSVVTKVSDRARDVLHKIAKLSIDSEIDALIVNKVESIFGSILMKVRIPGGRPPRKENAVDNDILVAARVTSFVIQSLSQSFGNATFTGQSEEFLDARAIISPEEVVRELISRFDLAGSCVHSHSLSAGVFLALFQNISHLLFAFYKHYTKKLDSNKCDQNTKPWFDLLKPYRMTALTPEEGFAKHFKEKEQSRKDLPDTISLPTSHLQRDTDFMALLIARSAYTLSHPSLSIQIKSCEALISGFSFLAIIASIPELPGEEETNGPRTAILRQIHSAWPAVSARLKAVCAEVRPSNKTSLVVMFSESQSINLDVSEKRVFLAKLFELVAGMAEASDDFMARRFRDVVWPCICGLMTYFLKRPDPKLSAHTSSFAESEIDLLCSMISCCARMFRHQPTGEVLSGLIPAIGGVFIPFLGDENQRVADLCMDSLQAMLCIDSDALRRPLFELAGYSFRPCPLIVQSDRETGGTVSTIQRNKAVDAANSAAEKAAQLLIDFMENLPEQPLVF